MDDYERIDSRCYFRRRLPCYWYATGLDKPPLDKFLESMRPGPPIPKIRVRGNRSTEGEMMIGLSRRGRAE